MNEALQKLLRRLEKVKVSAYGVKKSALRIIEALTDEELETTFETVLEDLLQEGRYIEDD